MHYIVMFSGGIASWGAAKRVVDFHGRDDVTLLFTDTLVEDPDLYRFLDEGAGALGLEVTRVADGRTPWEVFRDVRFLGNDRVAPCSRVLKQEQARKWLAENYPDPESCILYLGMDWTEGDRHKLAAKNWLPYTVESPLLWEPPVMKHTVIEWVLEADLDVPELYLRGATNNNCAGQCVRGGQAHWKWLLYEYPERYADAERHEESLRSMLGDVSILADRRGLTEGESRRPLPLRQFRAEVLDGAQIDMFDVGACSCFVDGGSEWHPESATTDSTRSQEPPRLAK